MKRYRAALVGALLAGMAPTSPGLAAAPPAPNVVQLEVRTPHGGFNRLLVSIRVCVPGKARCLTIDDVMVDTGSTGLRLEQAALPPSFHLPALVDQDRHPLAECVRFIHDSAWGDLFRADVQVGGMTAAGIPVQVIGAGLAHRPTSCPLSETPATANGTLGIGPRLTDCDGDCVGRGALPTVFTCGAEGCAPIRGPVDKGWQLPNPVARFPRHNNGIVVGLPAAPAAGTVAVVGTLTFGVGTEANNGLGQARLLKLDGHGRFTTDYDGRSYPGSYIDSGTENNVIPDDRLPRCRGMDWAVCASTPLSLRATMVGSDGAASATAFAVGDYAAQRDRGVGASGSLATVAPSSSRAFVWGAPFFLGKRVFVVIDGKAVPGSPGVVGPLYGFLDSDRP